MLRKVISAALSFLSVYAVGSSLHLYDNNALNRNVLAVILFVLLYRLFEHTARKLRQYSLRAKLLMLPVSMFLAFSLVYGKTLSLNDWVILYPRDYMKMALFVPCLYAFLLHLIHFEVAEKAADHESTFFRKKGSMIVIVVIMLLVWSFALLSHFPGHWGYDAFIQYNQFISGSVTTHHPILHTYLLCGLVWLGNAIFGSHEVGLLIYTVLQMIILAYALSRAVGFVSRYSQIYAYVCWGLFVFMPYHAIMSISATKDVLFSAFMLLLCIKLTEMASEGTQWQRKGNMAELIILLFLTCAFRNNGIYVVIASLPLLLWLNRNEWKRFCISFGAFLMLWVVYTGPVYKFLKVEKGSVREMLAIPIQQLSAVYMSWDGDITMDEKYVIYQCLPNVTYYKSRVADDVKDQFSDEFFRENKEELARLYLDLCRRNIGYYINAWANTTIGLWYPNMPYPDHLVWHPYMEWNLPEDDTRRNADIYVMQIKPKSLIGDKADELYQRFAVDCEFEEIPLFSSLCNIGFYAWILIIEFVACIVKRKYELLSAVLPAVLYWGTCLLGPVVLFRYGYAYLLISTVMLAPVFIGKESR